MAAVGFEPTPSKWLVPKTSALDHSATLPHSKPLHKVKQNLATFEMLFLLVLFWASRDSWILWKAWECKFRIGLESHSDSQIKGLIPFAVANSISLSTMNIYIHSLQKSENHLWRTCVSSLLPRSEKKDIQIQSIVARQKLFFLQSWPKNLHP